jgi:hypothetical protein
VEVINCGLDHVAVCVYTLVRYGVGVCGIPYGGMCGWVDTGGGYVWGIVAGHTGMAHTGHMGQCLCTALGWPVTAWTPFRSGTTVPRVWERPSGRLGTF